MVKALGEQRRGAAGQPQIITGKEGSVYWRGSMNLWAQLELPKASAMVMQFLSLVLQQSAKISIFLLKEEPVFLVSTIHLPLKFLSLSLRFTVVISSSSLDFESHLDV